MESPWTMFWKGGSKTPQREMAMSVELFASKARKHWSEWLPKKTAELEASGQLKYEIHAAAMAAQERLLELMEQGFRHHEAEEVALKEFVLLPPEPLEDDDWEAKELAELEAEYRRAMREPRDQDRPTNLE